MVLCMDAASADLWTSLSSADGLPYLPEGSIERVSARQVQLVLKLASQLDEAKSATVPGMLDLHEPARAHRPVPDLTPAKFLSFPSRRPLPPPPNFAALAADIASLSNQHRLQAANGLQLEVLQHDGRQC